MGINVPVGLVNAKIAGMTVTASYKLVVGEMWRKRRGTGLVHPSSTSLVVLRPRNLVVGGEDADVQQRRWTSQLRPAQSQKHLSL